MLTDWLLDHRWSGPLAAVLLLTVLPAVGWWTLSRRWAARALLAVSVVTVLALTLVPSGRRSPAVGCTVQWSVPTFGTVELMANVLVLVAPVLFAAVLWRSPARALGAGVAASAAVEVTQAFVLDLGRACDTNDWWCNSLGAAVGAGLAWGLLTRSRRAGTAATVHP